MGIMYCNVGFLGSVKHKLCQLFQLHHLIQALSLTSAIFVIYYFQWTQNDYCPFLGLSWFLWFLNLKVWFSQLYVPLVSWHTCPGKKITILSNRERRNTLDVLLSTPLTTLSVSPAISEVIKLLIFLPSLTGAPEVLCHSVREYSWLLGI